MTKLGSIAVIAVALLSPARTNADDGAASAWTKRRLALDLHVGASTPLGLVGAAVEVTPIQYWTVTAGTGLSYGGEQFAVGTRARYPFSADGASPPAEAFAIGVGTSFGSYKTCGGAVDRGIPGDYCVEPEWTKRWALAYWLFAQASYEHRWPGGIQFRAYVGLSGLLNPNAGACQLPGSGSFAATDCTHPPPGSIETLIVYTGIAFGYAFPL